MTKALSGHSPNTHIRQRVQNYLLSLQVIGESVNQNMEMPNLDCCHQMRAKMWKLKSSFGTDRSAKHWEGFAMQ